MTLPASHSVRARVLAYVLAIAVTVIEVVLDLTTWVDLDIATIYGIPLVIVAFTRDRRLLWTLTVALALTTFIAYALQVPAGEFELGEARFVNRVLATVSLLIIAGLLHFWMTSLDIRDAQARLLEKHFHSLEAVNILLVDREAQIMRQNQELVLRRLEADKASERKTRLLNAVAHDVRNPLHAINLMADAIRRAAEDPALSAKVPQMTHRLQSSARSMAALVADVLDIAYFDSGLAQRHDTVFSLDEVIEAACHDFTPLAEVKMLHLQAQASDRDIRVRTDRVKLERIVDNLVTNAIKFTVKGSVVLHAAVAADGAATITIRDTGVGIPENQLEHVFDEFARLDTVAGNPDRGWGLGLPICRALAEVIGARIDVQSEVNTGTLFTIRLPPECMAAATSGASSGPSPLEAPADPVGGLTGGTVNS
ncbi:MAG: HAMP domain-containing histidine kinase [Burkholderiaceae bacterium]|nr:HAMP domain-containing histidine kinase [Burkholderiaceae bacterium]